MQVSLSIWGNICSSTDTAMASVGQTRTQAKHETQSSASMTKFKDLSVRGREGLQFDGPAPHCQDVSSCKVCVQLRLQACIVLQSVSSQESGVRELLCDDYSSYITTYRW